MKTRLLLTILNTRFFKNKAGYAKIQFCGEQAKRDGLEYFWVDTCCINKANHVELSEAITSMFCWYRNADKCYVYLSDVLVYSTGDDTTKRTWELDFRKSRWFKRGWTLQELLAPASVEFFSQKWERLGNKDILEQPIHEITGIPITALHGTPLSQFSVDERLRWAAKRETKKQEDKAYCLLGIFNVFLPLIYGEGQNAFARLKEEIDKSSRRRMKEIEFLRSLDKSPYRDRKDRNPDRIQGTCEWFVTHEHFRDWQESRSSSMLWVSADPGCGKNSRLVLDTVTAAERGETIKIHHFIPDIEGILPAWKDWAVLLASMLKVGEAAALHMLGSRHLWYWTMCGWLHAFISAVLLQLLNLGRDHPLRTGSDIAAGVLPTPLHLGGNGKIVLGIPTNVRRHPLWRALLGLGVIFNVAGVLGTFLFLGREPPIVSYVWIGFQGLWLVSRIVVFYFVEGAAAGKQGISASKSWEESSDQDRRCVIALLSELSKHQVSIHPRGAHAYRYDCLSLEELCSHLSQASWTLTHSLPAADPRVLQNRRPLDIRTVAGDVLIRSIVWFAGAANLSNSDLYDACIALISCSQSKQSEVEKPDTTATIAAIPCVRVYACSCTRIDLHRHGRAGCAELLEWLYFIPTAGDDGLTWTFAHGRGSTESLADEELHSQLKSGRWNISLSSIGELKSALEVSRSAARLLVEMLKRVQVETKTPIVKVESSGESI